MLLGVLRLIGSVSGFGGGLIADGKSNRDPSGEEPLPETKPGGDQAEETSQQSCEAMH